MTDLLGHIRAMQAAVTDYLTPEPYIAKVDGKDYKAGARCAHGGELAKDALLNDLIYMLNGPEQRAAERDHTNAIDGFKAQVGDLEDANRAMRDRVAVSESDKGRATAALGEERKVQNDLRTRLYNSELAYAKLHGYLEGRQDAEPPRMVPEQREPLMARMPDASGVSTGWRNDATHWFHRG